MIGKLTYIKSAGLIVFASSFFVSANTQISDRGMSFDEYVKTLKSEAIEQGISRKTVDSAFESVEFKPRAVSSDRSQPEAKLTLDQYLPRAVPQWKVKQAKQKYRQYQTQLQRIGQEYGVQPRFIVALWGVESNFGALTGGYQVIDALSTMAYEGRREAFFRNEVMSALTIIDQGHISAADMKGSWAGAMGQPQFMPSSFLKYAADGNGDGSHNIWHSEADVFASAANYLKQVGWDDTYTWGRQVTLSQPVKKSDFGLKPQQAKTLIQWQALGVRNLQGHDLPKLNKEIDAWLIAPDSPSGRVYLVYDNYQVLMDWNRSYYFGLAVSSLADQLK
ncbi:lytic transglycosylase [Vibrio sp. UCD-FRSSP16_10]|uniref:lytic murein transglycosylase n=1 Tax=unclassified Vibrio TaxID=2614977 RepID=UPI0007FD9681|nr:MULTISPECIES: lytic murein transglycosylase [unclassified Vibrio]OBT08552.1 lytic transglycosylase [Vibrio sp. UCD-FRSSP16_30]OBT18082.1 lytic transglycosylase [Vibrio sp. UCD-FRSSP16_10]